MMDKQEIWGEIRQLVLGEGPIIEEIDKQVHEAEIEAECDFSEQREGLIAQMVAIRCAAITQEVEGQFQGAPIFIILGSWAGEAQQHEQKAMMKNLKPLMDLLSTHAEISELPCTTDEDSEED